MDLERLIATEQRLDEALRAAREEGTRLVAEVQAVLRRREEGLEAELQDAARKEAAETAAERERRVQDVSSEAARAVARYEAITADQVAAAARAVVDHLVAGEPVP